MNLIQNTTALVASSLLLMASTAVAQWQPTKPITVYLPFAAGGGAEVTLRALTDPLKERLKQPIIIEPKPGGGQLIAAQTIARAAPDGHSVLWAASTLVVSPILSNAAFDILKDLQPVVYTTETAIMLVVNSAVPARNIAEFIRYLKSNPGKLSYGFSGNGSSMHMAGELLKARTGVEMTAVPYKGSSQLLPDLLAGRVEAAIEPISLIKPHAETGKLRILAMMNRQRLSLLPDVPTMAESGYDGFHIAPWSGFFVRVGTPREIVETLNRETNEVLRMPAVVEKLKAAGSIATGGTQEQFADLLRQDIAQTTKIIRTAGIRAD